MTTPKLTIPGLLAAQMLMFGCIPADPPVIWYSGQSNATITFGSDSYNHADLEIWNDSANSGAGAWEEARVDLSGDSQWLGTGHVLGRLGHFYITAGSEKAYVLNTGWSGRALTTFRKGSTVPGPNPDDPSPSSGPNNYNQARTWWTNSGKEPRVLFFDQGETDHVIGTTTDDYADYLDELVTDWFADYPELKRVILIETAISPAISAAQQRVAARKEGVELVSRADMVGDYSLYGADMHMTEAGADLVMQRGKGWVL